MKMAPELGSTENRSDSVQKSIRSLPETTTGGRKTKDPTGKFSVMLVTASLMGKYKVLLAESDVVALSRTKTLIRHKLN